LIAKAEQRSLHPSVLAATISTGIGIISCRIRFDVLDSPNNIHPGHIPRIQLRKTTELGWNSRTTVAVSAIV
jgi:hypothetical protein